MRAWRLGAINFLEVVLFNIFKVRIYSPQRRVHRGYFLVPHLRDLSVLRLRNAIERLERLERASVFVVERLEPADS